LALIRFAVGIASSPVGFPLIALLKMVIASDADPHLLAGALVEGIAATIAAKIPPERRGHISVQLAPGWLAASSATRCAGPPAVL